MEDERAKKKPAWVDAYLREEERERAVQDSLSLAAWKLMELVNEYAVAHGELPKSTAGLQAICDLDGRAFWKPWGEIRRLYPVVNGQRALPGMVEAAIERRKARMEAARTLRRGGGRR